MTEELGLLDHLGHGLHKPLLIRLVAYNRLTFIAASRGMIDGMRNVNGQAALPRL